MADSKRVARKAKPRIPQRAKRAGNMTSLIYDELRQKILSGHLEPGSPLSVLSIARAGGTSRGPVREALRRLQQDQLVIGHANRRFNIAPFDIEDFEAVLSLHLVNITLAIRVGVPFLSDADIDGLEERLQRLEQTQDADKSEWEEAYRAFIFDLIKHTGERTILLIGNLIDDIQRYRAKVLDEAPPISRPSGAAFKRIAKAAAERDGVTASRLYTDLFGRLASLILAGAAPHYDASRLRNYMSALLPADHI